MSDFVNVTFPDWLAFGSQASVTWQTNLTRSSGGNETTNQQWEDDLIEFDASFAVQDSGDYASIRDHFHEVRGRAKSFLFKNYLDYTVTQAQGALLDLSGVAPTANGTFYLHKKYGSTNPYYKKISRPDTPAVIYRTRASVTSVITPTVTYTTGAVALTGHVAGDTYAWSGTFKVRCRYLTDKLPGVVIDREPGESGQLFVRCEAIPIREVRE